MKYEKGPVFLTDPSPFETYVLRELDRLSEVLEGKLDNPVPILYSEPKQKVNQIVSADGTTWNPGGGAGLYYWNGAAWTKL